MSEKDSKNRILAVTMEMLSNKPMENVTIREIAKLAKVNIASIHYYFSSKENLFSEALDKIIFSSMDAWVAANINLKSPKKTDLINLLEYLHLGCVINREFAKTRIRNNLNSDNANAANVKVNDTLFALTKNLKLEPDIEKLKLKVSLLYGSLAAISCSVAEMDVFSGTQLSDPAALRRYVKNIVKIIFE